MEASSLSDKNLTLVTAGKCGYEDDQTVKVSITRQGMDCMAASRQVEVLARANISTPCPGGLRNECTLILCLSEAGETLPL